MILLHIKFTHISSKLFVQKFRLISMRILSINRISIENYNYLPKGISLYHPLRPLFQTFVRFFMSLNRKETVTIPHY